LTTPNAREDADQQELSFVADGSAKWFNFFGKQFDNFYLFIYSFIYFGGTGVSTRGFMLTKQALYCLSHTCSLFSSVYFRDGI
jgi:hypothetical protein